MHSLVMKYKPVLNRTLSETLSDCMTKRYIPGSIEIQKNSIRENFLVFHLLFQTYHKLIAESPISRFEFDSKLKWLGELILIFQFVVCWLYISWIENCMLQYFVLLFCYKKMFFSFHRKHKHSDDRERRSKPR